MRVTSPELTAAEAKYAQVRRKLRQVEERIAAVGRAIHEAAADADLERAAEAELAGEEQPAVAPGLQQQLDALHRRRDVLRRAVHLAGEARDRAMREAIRLAVVELRPVHAAAVGRVARAVKELAEANAEEARVRHQLPPLALPALLFPGVGESRGWFSTVRGRHPLYAEALDADPPNPRKRRLGGVAG